MKEKEKVSIKCGVGKEIKKGKNKGGQGGGGRQRDTE